MWINSLIFLLLLSLYGYSNEGVETRKNFQESEEFYVLFDSYSAIRSAPFQERPNAFSPDFNAGFTTEDVEQYRIKNERISDIAARRGGDIHEVDLLKIQENELSDQSKVMREHLRKRISNRGELAARYKQAALAFKEKFPEVPAETLVEALQERLDKQPSTDN